MTAGSTVTYHVWAPAVAGVTVSPMLMNSSWTTTVLAAQQLQTGWNTVTFTIPAGTTTLNELGLQINDPNNWTG